MVGGERSYGLDALLLLPIHEESSLLDEDSFTDSITQSMGNRRRRPRSPGRATARQRDNSTLIHRPVAQLKACFTTATSARESGSSLKRSTACACDYTRGEQTTPEQGLQRRPN